MSKQHEVLSILNNQQIIVEEIQEKLQFWQFSIQSHPYHTSYVATMLDENGLVFPETISYLLESQFSDGSWGSAYVDLHERVLTTAAVVSNLIKIQSYIASDMTQSLASAKKYILQHLSQVLRVSTNFAAYGFVLPVHIRRIASFLQFRQSDPAITKMIASVSRKAEQIQSYLEVEDISGTYYLLSLEGFSDTYLRSLNPDRILGREGSVAGVVSSTAKFYSIIEDETMCNKIEGFLQSLQNKDHGFGNFSADILSYLFGILPLAAAGAISDIGVVMKQLEQYSSSKQATGLPYSTFFPTPDLDNTLAYAYIKEKISENTDPDLEEILSIYKNANYRTYLKARSKSTRAGEEVVEVDVLSKIIAVSHDTKENDRLLELIIEHLNNLPSRWHVLHNYTLANVFFALENQSPNQQLLDLLHEQVTIQIKKVTSAKLNLMESALVLYSTGRLYQFGRRLDDESMEMIHKLASFVFTNRLHYQDLPQLWIAKLLNGIEFMDFGWVYASLYLYYNQILANDLT